MKLFYAAGACSIGIHVLLEEIGKPYETAAVDLRGGEQFKPPFVELNPKSKVPALELDDGSVLTEFPAIGYYLARLNPGLKLLPDDFAGQARCLELMDYAVATLHMHGFSRLFRPSNYTPNATDEAGVKERGTEMVASGFAIMEKALAGRDYLLATFTIADAALFYVEFWAKRLNLALPPHCGAHLERMLARPAVQRTLAAEGLA